MGRGGRYTSQNGLLVQSGGREIGGRKSPGPSICATVIVDRELVATCAPFGRDRLGKRLFLAEKNPFHRFLENAECKLLFIHRQTFVFP